MSYDHSLPFTTFSAYSIIGCFTLSALCFLLLYRKINRVQKITAELSRNTRMFAGNMHVPFLPETDKNSLNREHNLSERSLSTPIATPASTLILR